MKMRIFTDSSYFGLVMAPRIGADPLKIQELNFTLRWNIDQLA